ncbi:TolC family protein [Coraliomargarita algicola]|uniref:TolC family protein n=1 Tax=Coraliomargarita algicola TaxID=3092156 RepID=A0ABZ0RP63_9BACT|nr:TolC family protein [Coraliomargarita sp. J2-16]WPJ96908.1 TolC family protein [Coraliomargarita sp. J2-16]
MPPRLYSYLLPLVLFTGALSAESPELPLKVAIASALEHNIGLRIAAYEPANARDSVEIEDAQFDPSFFANTSIARGQSALSSSSETDSRAASIGVDQRLATGATVTLDSDLSRSSSNSTGLNPDYGADVGLSIRQPLLKDAGATVNLAPLARAKVNAERSLYELRSDVLDLVLATEIAYWNLAYARADRALIASSLALAENLREENVERERLGLVTPLEVLQAEAEVLNQQESVIQADNVIADAEDTLRRVMGLSDFLETITDDVIVSALPEQMEPLRPIDVVVKDTVLNDIDAKVQERLIEVQRINHMLAQEDTRPDLDLTGGLSYLGREETGSRAYRGVSDADGYAWSLGLEVSVPWGFREARARARQAERSVEQATWQLYDIKQEKALAARNAWRSASTGLKRIEVTRAAMILNEEAFEQERARYGSGLVAYRSVLEAQRDYDRAKSNYLGSLIETLRASVRLSRVDGTLLQRNGLDWDAVEPYTQLNSPTVELDASLLNNTP